MTFDPSVLIDWISSAAPVGFVLASLGGVVGSLVASFAFRSALKDETLSLEIKKLLMQDLEQIDANENVKEKYERVLKHLEELEKQQSSRSMLLSKLGEYLSNHSPSDVIVKGVKQ